jgi:hypothetical protein
MARRGTPALYELLGRGREGKATPVIPVNIPTRTPVRSGRSGVSVGPGATSARPASARASDASPSTAPSLGPALDPQVVKIAGFSLCALIVLVGVYWLGVARGGSNATHSQGVIASDGTAVIQPSAVASAESREPIGQPAAQRAENAPASTPPAGLGGAEVAASNTASRPLPRTAPAVTSPELGSPLPPAQRGIDPRQAGLNYIVIASVLEANADKLVAFCRERGLDAWVVPDHNGRLREITVLPGIPSSEKKGAVAKALDERIRKVGQQWKAAARGNSDFEDRYMKLFNG